MGHGAWRPFTYAYAFLFPHTIFSLSWPGIEIDAFSRKAIRRTPLGRVQTVGLQLAMSEACVSAPNRMAC